MTRFGYLILAAAMLVIVLTAWLWPAEPAVDVQPPTATSTPASKDDLIVVSVPLPNAAISSPLMVSGRARGNWYFEASFPVKVYDGNGKLLTATPATAAGEWMTMEYVPFIATITFPVPTTATGTIVFEKNNASGLPEHANELVIPIRFAIFDPNAPAPGNTTPANGTPIKLYYYNPALDAGPGGPACSRNGLVAVERTIPKTETPLTDTIRLLLRGELTDAERGRGITTEFPLPGLTLEGVTLVGGVATLTFTDPQNKSSGGACRVAVLRAQIEATAKQFPSVSGVVIEPATLFQP